MDVKFHLPVEEFKTTTFNGVDTEKNEELFALLVQGFALTSLTVDILAELLGLSSLNEVFRYISCMYIVNKNSINRRFCRSKNPQNFHK